MKFCLQSEESSKISIIEFLQLNWLNVHDRFLQFIGSDIFKFHNNALIILMFPIL